MQLEATQSVNIVQAYLLTMRSTMAIVFQTGDLSNTSWISEGMLLKVDKLLPSTLLIFLSSSIGRGLISVSLSFQFSSILALRSLRLVQAGTEACHDAYFVNASMLLVNLDQMEDIQSIRPDVCWTSRGNDY